MTTKPHVAVSGASGGPQQGDDPRFSATVWRLETPFPPALRADHGRRKHRITGRVFGWRTNLWEG